jgi:hypothetical protein
MSELTCQAFLVLARAPGRLAPVPEEASVKRQEAMKSVSVPEQE